MTLWRNRRTTAGEAGPATMCTTVPDRPTYQRYHVTFSPFTAANGDHHRDLTLTVYGTDARTATAHAELLLELDYAPQVDPDATHVVLATPITADSLTLRA